MQQSTAPMNMMPLMPSSFPPNITTDQIQKYLDENKKLILAIMDNQNLGKLAECAQYQAQLQKNLMYLAAIADAQPQIATMPSQVSPLPSMQQGPYFMNPAMAQPQGVFPPKMHPLQSGGPMPTSAVGGDVRSGNKQEGLERGSSGDGQGKSGMGGDGLEGGK